jgi:hypothetical protein
MEYGDDYGELCAFSNIMYTPAWYYKQFPGFYNVECYKILANWSQGVRTEEQYQRDMEPETPKENKKRSREDEEFMQDITTSL